MDITIQDNRAGICLDIRVNREQKIQDTLRILQEGELIPGRDTARQIYSHRLKRTIDLELTYAQAGIYNGDILQREEGSIVQQIEEKE